MKRTTPRMLSAHIWLAVVASVVATFPVFGGDHAPPTIRKARLRFFGCAIGGLLGFLAIMYLVPHMESIVSLAFLTAAGAALAGWVAAGSERISYAGLQIALAFFMCIFQGFAPDTHFGTIRNRVVGILLGILVTSVVFYNLWPERQASGQKTVAR